MKKFLFIIAAVLVLGGGGVAVVALYSNTRGLRNNNPGNLRKTGDKWQGLAAVQDDPAFFKFIGPEWGIRALLVLLSNYYNKYGLMTVEKIIARYAPSTENNTQAYINFVADYLGVKPKDYLNLNTQRIDLAKAIIKMENGMQPYSNELFMQAEGLI